MLHIPPTNLLLLAAKQEAYKNACLLTKKFGRIFLEKVQENGPAGRKKEKEKKKRQRNRTRQKNKRGDSKVESYDSPGIPDRRET